MDDLQRLGKTEVSPSPLIARERSPLLKRSMPGLDALRGFAVLIVVLYHGIYWYIPGWASSVDGKAVASRLSIFKNGWIGVNLFFLLSGFLITGILLDTRESKHFWKNFYLRRMLRIMPLLVFILLWLKFTEPIYTWHYVVACLFYLGNLTTQLHVSGQSYGPLWSLAVEEQFYLVWPFLAKFLPRRAFALVSVGCVVGMPLIRYASETHSGLLGNPHTMTWLIADNLAAGACLALMLRTPWATVAKVKAVAWSLLGIGMVMFAVSVKQGWLHHTSAVGAALQICPFIALFGALLLASLFIGDWPFVMKLTWPLRGLGYISYGLYLYHIIVIGYFDTAVAKLGLNPTGSLTVKYMIFRFAVSFTAMLVISYLSRRYFEEFFLRLKDRKAHYSAKEKHKATA